MMGEIPPQSFGTYRRYIEEVFGGQDKAHPGGWEKVSRVAIVGAMTDALVREAASRGANLYITGQLRKPAEEAVLETGIGVIAVGHRRCEEWGLRALAGVMRERWAGLKVILPPRV
jgi:putative NIF3 family GTP cyclohydrolase 1 type 2